MLYHCIDIVHCIQRKIQRKEESFLQCLLFILKVRADVLPLEVHQQKPLTPTRQQMYEKTRLSKEENNNKKYSSCHVHSSHEEITE